MAGVWNFGLLAAKTGVCRHGRPRTQTETPPLRVIHLYNFLKSQVLGYKLGGIRFIGQQCQRFQWWKSGQRSRAGDLDE